MDRDREAFLNRFLLYKNGKPISEIYDAGLPKYQTGKISKFKESLDGEYKNVIDNTADYFIEMGVDPMIISGILGNMALESGFNPYAIGPGGFSGTVLMSKDMAKEIKRAYGNVDFMTTNKFIHDAMSGNEIISEPWRNHMKQKGGYYGRTFNNPADAAIAFGRVFERPNEKYANWSLRAASAQDAYDYLIDRINSRKPKSLSQTTMAEYDSANLWKPAFLPELKNGKLPEYSDGTRYLWDDQNQLWDRITNDPMARAFADLTVTPSGNRDDNRTNPIYHDKRLKNAGYVTLSMLEDLYNAAKQHETGQYAPGLETVSPEFDLLFMGAGLRSNPLTQQLWRNRSLSNLMNKVFDEGLVGATKDMPVLKPLDMYNPEHMLSTVKYNPKQIALTTVEDAINEAPINSITFKSGEMPPEATYAGNVPKTVVNQNELGLHAQLILNPEIFTPELKALPEPTWYDETFVDRTGKVNVRAVTKAVKDFYKTHPNAGNYKNILNSSGNLYHHIRDVVKSAQQIPVPEGYTRQELVLAALFHDIGKVFESGHSHGHVGAEMLDDLGINVSESVKRAVDNHMSSGMLDKDELTKALHFADVARGEGWDEAAFKYPHLTYNFAKPELNIPKIPLREELKTRINPWLRNKGYETIPLDISEEEAWNILEDRISQHRSFLRGARDPLKRANEKSDDIRNAANAIKSVMEEYGLSYEQAKSDAASDLRIRVSALNVPKDPTGPSRRSYLYGDKKDGDLTKYTRTDHSKAIGANPNTTDALYVSTSDDVASNYATANTDDRSGAAFIVELPKAQRRSGESMSEYLLRNDFDMIDLNSIFGGQKRGTGSMYVDPYRLLTGRSLLSDMVKEGVILPKYVDNLAIVVKPGDRASVSTYTATPGYREATEIMKAANDKLKKFDISFEITTAKDGSIYMPASLDRLNLDLSSLDYIKEALTPSSKFSTDRYDYATRQKLIAGSAWNTDDLFGFTNTNILSTLSPEQRVSEMEALEALSDPEYVKYALGIEDINSGSKKYYDFLFPKTLLLNFKKLGFITSKQYDAIKIAYKNNRDAKKYINFKNIANKLLSNYLLEVKKNAHKKKKLDPKSLHATPQQMANFLRSKGVLPRYEIEGYGDNKLYVIEANAANKTKNAGDVKRTYGYILGRKGEKLLNIKKEVDTEERKFKTGAGKDDGKYSGRKISRKTLRSLLPIIGTGTAASTLKPRKKKNE